MNESIHEEKKLWKATDKLSNQQVNRLVAAYNENTELRGSFGFNGKKSCYYGDGLAFHLSRLTDQTYRLSRSGKIEIVWRHCRQYYLRALMPKLMGRKLKE